MLLNPSAALGCAIDVCLPRAFSDINIPSHLLHGILAQFSNTFDISQVYCALPISLECVWACVINSENLLNSYPHSYQAMPYVVELLEGVAFGFISRKGGSSSKCWGSIFSDSVSCLDEIYIRLVRSSDMFRGIKTLHLQFLNQISLLIIVALSKK